MTTGPLFAAALVAGVRRHGTRPARPGGPSWSTVADLARALALGLDATGWSTGTRIRVRGAGMDPPALVARELAVLAVGAALVVDDDAGHDVEIAGDGATGPGGDHPVAALRERGLAVAADRPAAHEEHLAAIAADAPAVVAAHGSADHARMGWALRSVGAWLGGPLPAGPERVVGPAVAPGGERTADALVARWWPASRGATLADRSMPVSDLEAVRRLRPDLVVLDADGWCSLADAVRAGADRSRAGRVAVRTGRVEAAGEAVGGVERSAARAARRWSRVRLAAGAGLDRLGAGVCLGALAPVDDRDLAAVGLPVARAWVEAAVPAPVAASSFVRADGRWGRPLPGRSVEVGATVVVHGGDLGSEGAVARGRTRVDDRGRVELAGGT